ncbi:extracellular matrix regulator RemB [Senegalia massiliensis]|uniref:extracellular matrix regulator RemB n=1 Tax=Senegalia massiliensis TaxID=1720316 RepID=UPI0010309FA3|nr:extracellular matrix/biofilm biosynthesis regulator RemA family protein [Senegalia massiliensis]
MYVHIGGDYVIPFSEIVSIINVDSMISRDTREFIRVCKEEGFLINIVDQKIKTFIITEEKLKNTKSIKHASKSIVYCTNIKSTTIYKRINKIKEWGNTYGVK